MNRKLKICFMGGKQASIIGALSILSQGHKITSAVSYSTDLSNILNSLNIPVYKTIKEKKFIRELRKSDLLLSVHGREIVKPKLLRLTKFGGINVHPYLYKYKGSNPVERALRDREFRASVGAHFMENEVDEGKVIVEEFVNVSGANSVDEIYNRLYSYYCIVILKLLNFVQHNYKKHE